MTAMPRSCATRHGERTLPAEALEEGSYREEHEQPESRQGAGRDEDHSRNADEEAERGGTQTGAHERRQMRARRCHAVGERTGEREVESARRPGEQASLHGYRARERDGENDEAKDRVPTPAHAPRVEGDADDGYEGERPEAEAEGTYHEGALI